MTRYSKSMASSEDWWAPGGVDKENGCSPGLMACSWSWSSGDGKLVVPVDFAIRRPDPKSFGGPCRAKLRWLQVMLNGRVAALRRRGLELHPPMVVADS
jgi:hypothetical protein